jgi:hypothetical protein
VQPDGTFVELLAFPQKAHEFFFTQERPGSVLEVAWKGHVLASKMVCYELCAIANNHPLLDVLVLKILLINLQFIGIRIVFCRNFQVRL